MTTSFPAPAALLCELKDNPLGLDIANPRLSWQLRSLNRGARQTAYQIIVASSEDLLTPERADLWDSGQISSDASIHIIYEGKPLSSRQRAWWMVRVWDENDEVSEWSAPAWWEAGLLKRDEWTGSWIGGALSGGPQTTVPCPFLRTTFTIEKPFIRARLYSTCLGVYEYSCNGKLVSEDVFAPGWTEYRKRVQYQTYDVSDLLHEGENAMGAVLGDGWYCGHLEWRARQHYGDRPRLLAQIVVDFQDGTTQTVETNNGWKTAFGPFLESDMLMGESYDARREFESSGATWSQSAFDGSAWKAVDVFEDTGIEISPMIGPPVRRQEELAPISEPKKVPRWPVDQWVFDLGQNMVGRVRLKVSGTRGTTITLRFGEVVNPDGSLYTENLRSARQTDHYTLKGEGEEVYEPTFTFHGFRYVELTGLSEPPSVEMVTGIVLHSDCPKTGEWSCSEPLLNQLQRNIEWGQKGNWLEVPTDCPQRDERMGWTGDAQVFARTAAFNLDVATFFAKWQRDIADAQAPDGKVPYVIPDTGIPGEGDGGAAWAEAALICPWTIYKYYGDTRILADHYDSMRRFHEYLHRTSRDLIRCYPEYEGFKGFGDWLSMDAHTPHDLIGTAFFVYATQLMAQIARVLNREDDAQQYEALLPQIKAAFVRRFVSRDGLLVSPTQTAHVLALYFDLLPQELRAGAVDALVRDIENRGTHLSTGFVGSPYLNHVLSDNGRLDVAYKLLNQKTWPSWLYAVTQGATTIWERWDGWTHDKGFQDAAMNSFNHYAYGAIGDWMVAVVAGLDLDSDASGYKRICFRPRLGGGLTQARASLHSLYGLIESDWNIGDDTFEWQIVVPPNTSATVHVPATRDAQIEENGFLVEQASGVTLLSRDDEAAVYQVQSGAYHFSVPLQSTDEAAKA